MSLTIISLREMRERTLTFFYHLLFRLLLWWDNRTWRVNESLLASNTARCLTSLRMTMVLRVEASWRTPTWLAWHQQSSSSTPWEAERVWLTQPSRLLRPVRPGQKSVIARNQTLKIFQQQKKVFWVLTPYLCIHRLHPASSDQVYGVGDGEVWRHGA